jgi:hypothetical protein
MLDECTSHDWEGEDFWGVIIGISKCKNCGKIAKGTDFIYKESSLD